MKQQRVLYSCQVDKISNSNVKQVRYLLLLENKLAISKFNTLTEEVHTLDMGSPKIKIAWEYKDGKLNGFLICHISVKGNQTKQLRYEGKEDSLNRAKQILDGKAFYYQFESQYETLKSMSSRKQSEIIQCKNKQTGAVKIAKKIFFNKNTQVKINYEAALTMKLKSYSHKNILQVDEIYKEENELIYIMDKCEGGTLFHYFGSRNFQMPLDEIRKIMKKILKAVNHLHELEIMHRDLKLDNIMFRFQGDIDSLKIIDFGLATVIEAKNQVQCGTPGYIAPEILNGEPYNQLCDIFSLGCLFHSLLTGQKLFPQSGDKNQLYALNKYNKYRLSEKLQDEEAKDLILKMILNQQQRPSAADCLEHPFFERKIDSNLSLRYKLKSMDFPVLKNPFHKPILV